MCCEVVNPTEIRRRPQPFRSQDLANTLGRKMLDVAATASDLIDLGFINVQHAYPRPRTGKLDRQRQANNQGRQYKSS